MPKIALLQMTSGVDPEANYAVIEQAVLDAAQGGARVMFLPEMALLLDRNRVRSRPWVESKAPREMIRRLEALSTAYMIDIAVGSAPVGLEDGKWANRSFFIDHMALLAAQYDKIHMFDVDLATGENWRESNAYQGGGDVVSYDSIWLGKIGLTICYDVRFPALWDELGRRRCDTIAVPAAFTVPTGIAHWHTLLRARAIEATAFIIAAAQVGKHEDGRETYGHSLVVDPWGEVLLDMGGDGPGLGFCDIDLSRIEEVRSQIPSLANKREIPKSPLS